MMMRLKCFDRPFDESCVAAEALVKTAAISQFSRPIANKVTAAARDKTSGATGGNERWELLGQTCYSKVDALTLALKAEPDRKIRVASSSWVKPGYRSARAMRSKVGHDGVTLAIKPSRRRRRRRGHIGPASCSRRNPLRLTCPTADQERACLAFPAAVAPLTECCEPHVAVDWVSPALGRIGDLRRSQSQRRIEDTGGLVLRLEVIG